MSLVYDSDHHWGLGLLTFGLICTVVLLPPTTAMGVLFPTLNSLYHERSRQVSGRSVSAVFASNTIGSIAGAVVVGFVLLPWVGIRGALMAMAGICLVLGWGFLLQSRRYREVLAGAVICTLLLSAGLQWRYLLGRGETTADRVLFYDEGLMSTVKVYERESHMHMSIDGSRIASTADHLPRIERFGVRGYAAYGYSGRGIGTGTLFGKALAQAALSAEEAALPLVPVPAYAEKMTAARALYYVLGFEPIPPAHDIYIARA